MVKVLENQIVDLDLLPGKEQQEIKAKIQAQIDAQGGVVSDQVKTATQNLPKEQQKQAEGVIAGASNVMAGVAGTAGGAVKGVLDTAGNTVGTLGSGLSDTVSGVTTGLGDATKQTGGVVRAQTDSSGDDAVKGGEEMSVKGGEETSVKGRDGKEMSDE